MNSGISIIPETIGEALPQLKYLGLNNNKITKIPRSITLLQDQTTFDIRNNPLKYPPSHVAERGIKAIALYYDVILTDKKDGTVGGINDSPTLDPDRLGYSIYAEALSSLIRKVESPQTSVYGAYYGSWGTGKSFLHKLTKQAQQIETQKLLDDILTERKNEEKEKKRISFKKVMRKY